MAIDLMKALKAPTATDGWIVKCIILGLLMLVPIVNLISFGYTFEYLHGLLKGKEELPDIDAGKQFVIGLKYIVGTILFIIPFLLLVMIIVCSGEKAPAILILVPVLYIAMALLMCTMMGSFAFDFKIFSFIDFQRGMTILKGNVGSLVMMIFMSMVISLVFGIVVGVLSIIVIGIILLPFLGIFMNIVMFNLFGQFVKSSPQFDELMKTAYVD